MEGTGVSGGAGEEELDITTKATRITSKEDSDSEN
jgi:hypothetical protein